jgi:hypothetical protein
LLHFQKQGAFPNGVDSSCRDIEKVSLVDRQSSKKIIPSSLIDHLFQLFPAFGVMPDNNIRVLVTVQDIPALRFSLTAVFVQRRIAVVGMNLNA